MSIPLNDDVWRAPPVRPTGPHKRRVWTPRALRRMMRDLGGAGGCDGPRPSITIIVPGELGTSGEAKDLPDCVDVGWYDAPAQTLLKALGFTRDDGVSHISKPHGTKYFYLGVLRGRWCFSGYLYSRSREHGYPGELPELAAFINTIQAATGCCAPVYGDRNPAHRAYWRRPCVKPLPFWRYLELSTMVREAWEQRFADMVAAPGGLPAALAVACHPNAEKRIEGLEALRGISWVSPPGQPAAIAAKLLRSAFGELMDDDTNAIAETAIIAGAPREATTLAITLSHKDPRWRAAAEALAAWGVGTQTVTAAMEAPCL